jgi:hypothetical protein
MVFIPISFFDFWLSLFLRWMRRKKRNEIDIFMLALTKSRARGVPVQAGLEGPAALAPAQHIEKHIKTALIAAARLLSHRRFNPTKKRQTLWKNTPTPSNLTQNPTKKPSTPANMPSASPS